MDKLKKRLPGDRTNLVDLGRNYRSDQFAFVNYTVIYKTKVERKDIELVDEEETRIDLIILVQPLINVRFIKRKHGMQHRSINQIGWRVSMLMQKPLVITEKFLLLYAF